MHFALRKTRNENIIDAIKDENIWFVRINRFDLT
jgi:hypothetical protein